MRRRVAWGGGVFLVIAVAVSACGSNEAESSGGGGTSASGGEASGGTSESGGSASGGEASGGAATGGGSGGSGVGGSGSGSGGGPAAGGSSTGSGGGVGTGGPVVGGCAIFPGDNPWNQDVSELPVHARSEAMIDSIGRSTTLHPDFGTEWAGAPIGIPYVLVDASQAPVDIIYEAYGDESDPGPFPIPLDAPIEGGESSDGDRHVIAIDTDECMLYEIYSSYPEADGWHANSGVAFDLTQNDDHPEGCTSADAAGLPIFPGLVRYEEVVLEGELRHAVRFTVSRSQRAYLYPARHYASSNTDPDLPAMGQRVRMKSSFDCSTMSQEARVICAGLKRYGMILADNGSDWYLSGAPDPRWDDDALGDLKQIPGDAFEVVETGETVVTSAPDCGL